MCFVTFWPSSDFFENVLPTTWRNHISHVQAIHQEIVAYTSHRSHLTNVVTREEAQMPSKTLGMLGTVWSLKWPLFLNYTVYVS